MHYVNTMKCQKGDITLEGLHMLADHPMISRDAHKGSPENHDKLSRTCVQGCELVHVFRG